MNHHRKVALGLMLGALFSGTSHAAGIASDTSTLSGAGTSIIDFNNFDGLVTTGPIDLTSMPGEVIFTSVPNSIVGADAQDLGTNGLWGARGSLDSELVSTPTGDGHFLASAFVSKRGELGFSFANPVSAVGAFFNQYQTNNALNQLTLVAYDLDGNTLETFSYAVDTDEFGYNEGKFLGIQRGNADIYGFGIADGTFVLDNLTFAQPVPEPGTYALTIAGLLTLMVWRRRDKR